MSAIAVAVVTVDDPGFAAELAHVLSDAGVRMAEVTLRTPHALDSLSRMQSVPGLNVGAGTVVDTEQVARAVAVGAKWVVSPGLDEHVVAAAHDRGAEAIPGIATASECQRARRLNVTRVKLFPIHLLGGRRFIEALAAPFPEMRFMPSGGVDDSAVGDLATHPSVFALASGWMVDSDLVEKRELGEIARRCALLVAATTAAGAPAPTT